MQSNLQTVRVSETVGLFSVRLISSPPRDDETARKEGITNKSQYTVVRSKRENGRGVPMGDYHHSCELREECALR